MSFVKNYLNAVWSTSNREPFLMEYEHRLAMWKHIKLNAEAKKIIIDHVNGWIDHCHCLISLSSDQSIDKVMQLIKGESAFWFNQQGFIDRKLKWQNEYYAASISEELLARTRRYIRNQEEHHRIKTFQEEYETLNLQALEKP